MWFTKVMEKKSREAKSGISGDNKIIHDFSNASKKGSSISSLSNRNKSMNLSKPPIALFVILLVLGIGTGCFVSKAVGSNSVTTVDSNGKAVTTTAKQGAIYGSKDEKTFKDNAEGTLKLGGVDGEGQYHLERPGGDSQNVYLTSSSIDLSTFVGKKVKVWGETNAAQKAGWLMDVGRLQLL